MRKDPSASPLCGITSVRRGLQHLPLVALLAMFSACGSAPAAQVLASATANPTPSPTPSSRALSCTPSGPASAWPEPWTWSDTTPRIRSANLKGDTLTLTFERGTPQFEVVPQSTSHLLIDSGKGGWIDLAGSAGVRIVLTGFRGDMANYVGPASLTSSGPLVRQVHTLGDWEGVVTWGAGVSEPACANVTASGSTLTFHFIRTPAPS